MVTKFGLMPTLRVVNSAPPNPLNLMNDYKTLDLVEVDSLARTPWTSLADSFSLWGHTCIDHSNSPDYKRLEFSTTTQN